MAGYTPASLTSYIGVRDMQNNYYIYKHTAPNGKVYIGQTCQKPETRYGKNGYRYKNCTLFYKAIQKYGWDNFKHEILFDGLNAEEANDMEISLISQYRSNESDFGYNLQNGGHNGSPSAETRQKMSEWQIGKIIPEETKQKISRSRFGQKDSDETRMKKSNSHRGKPVTEETKAKISKARAEKVTGEQKERVKQLGLLHKGTALSEATKKKMSESHKGRNAKKVLCIETDTTYNSISEAAQCTNIDGGNIGKVCNGNAITAGGYHWMFV